MPDDKKEATVPGPAPVKPLTADEVAAKRKADAAKASTPGFSFPKKEDPVTAVVVLEGARRPENASLRMAVGLAQEDALETLSKTAVAKSSLDINALLQLIATLGPLFASLFQKKAPEPTPPPKPVDVEPIPLPKPPNVVVPPGPVPREVVKHHIVGGRAYLTGITEGGPLGPRIGGDRLRAIRNGSANAPHDARFEFDFTPTFEDGHQGQPSGTNEAPDPYFITTPFAPAGDGDTVPPTQPVRLRFDWEGSEGSSADLSREYAANGCTPRIRVRTPLDGGGVLSNLRFEFEGGAVEVEGVDQIHVGRGAGEPQ